MNKIMKRALLMGFFCTIGDIDSLTIVKQWLDEAGVKYTIAPFGGPVLDAIPGAVLPETVNPHDYTHVIVICGPCDREFYAKRWPINPLEFLHCHFIGVNLSMITSLENWNPFDTLLERNSDRIIRPDLTLALRVRTAPVVGLCLAPDQPEYKERQLHAKANNLLRNIARRIDAAVVPIDTGWPKELNNNGLESVAQIEAVISRMDVILTTRLHGTVYALKHGIPAVVLDPVKGGDKVIMQARVLGWPAAYLVDTVDEDTLFSGLNYCLSKGGKSKAIECANLAKITLEEVHDKFLEALDNIGHGAALRWPAKKKERRTIIQRIDGVIRRYAIETAKLLLKYGRRSKKV